MDMAANVQEANSQSGVAFFDQVGEHFGRATHYVSEQARTVGGYLDRGGRDALYATFRWVLPDQAVKMDRLKSICEDLRLYALIGLVTSVFLVTIGALIVTFFGFTGVSFIGMGLPLGYIAYNGYVVTDNLVRLLSTPQNYLTAKARADCIAEKTYALTWLTPYIAKEVEAQIFQRMRR